MLITIEKIQDIYYFIIKYGYGLEPKYYKLYINYNPIYNDADLQKFKNDSHIIFDKILYSKNNYILKIINNTLYYINTKFDYKNKHFIIYWN